MGHVFISYSPADSEFVAELDNEFARRDVETWIDLQRLQPDQPWRTAIDQAVRDASAVLIVISPAALQSRFVTYEWAFARGCQKPLLAVVATAIESSDLHPALSTLRYHDFSGWDRDWDLLLAELAMVESPAAAVRMPRSASLPIRRAAKLLNSGREAGSLDGLQRLAQEASDPLALEALVQCLDHPIRRVRQLAADHVMALAHPAMVPGLIATLASPQPDVRRTAAQALGVIGDPEALPALMQAMEDAFGNVRTAAADALGAIGGVRAVGKLAVGLTDHSPGVRRASAAALRRINSPLALDALSKIATQEALAVLKG